jgi:hypothetical protein
LRKRLLITTAGAAAILLAGCATTSRIAPTGGQKVLWSNAVGIVQTGESIRCAIYPWKDDSSRYYAFAIEVYNNSNSVFNFGQENVQATGVDGRPLGFLTREGYIRRANARATGRAIALGFAAGLVHYIRDSYSSHMRI